MKAIAVPELFKEEVNTLVSIGYYPNEEEVVKDAIRSLLEERTNLRVEVAIKLFMEEKISIGKAAETAGVSTIEFKEILGRRGILRKIGSESIKVLETKVQGLERLIK
ncbi:MAG: UPF0175 family protein [bacterium]|nr:UPF0175 family protein [bacterium]